MKIAMIGPPNVGKSTVSREVAKHLGLTHHEYDSLRLGYFEEVGFDMEFNLALSRTQGMSVVYQYWKVFDPHAIERMIDACDGVLDFGGGAPTSEHPTIRRRVESAFARCDFVFLLLPFEDLDASMAVLEPRDSDPILHELTRYLIGQGSLQRLATHTILTGYRDPESVVRDVLTLIEA